MPDHAPLPGRRSWQRVCTCTDCDSAAPSRRAANQRRTKRREARATRREIDTALTERPPMQLYIEDTYRFFDVDRDTILQAFNTFEDTIKHHTALVEAVEDLDLATYLHKRELTFTCFVALPDNETPRYYATKAREAITAIAHAFILEWELPRSVIDNEFQISAEDDSFLATGELRFTVPAP